MKILYKIINFLRKIYWYIFRPRTIGVKCLVENTQGEYLLIKTSYSGDYWTIPGGGCKRNEIPEHASEREVREETGINIITMKRIGNYESTIEYKKDTIYLFYATADDIDLRKNKVEVAEAEWFPKNLIPNNQSKALRTILDLI